MRHRAAVVDKPKLDVHAGYGMLTLAYMSGIYWLSSRPGPGVSADRMVQFVMNLLHIPLYAGLTFCFRRALSKADGVRASSWEAGALTVLGTGCYAAFDEWHQSFVPGRHGSVDDFVFDLVGIGAMLLVFRLMGRAATDR